MPTSSYQAGTEANNAQLSYAVESAWGTNPGGAFNALRFTSETLSDTKTRQRPSEVNNNRESIQAVTTKEEAQGDISYALSYSTFDPLFQSVLGSTWTAALAIS